MLKEVAEVEVVGHCMQLEFLHLLCFYWQHWGPGNQRRRQAWLGWNNLFDWPGWNNPFDWLGWNNPFDWLGWNNPSDWPVWNNPFDW